MAKISHKDDLVIGNNYLPAANMSACCLYCDCHGVPKLPDVILLHFLLDSLPGDPPTWATSWNVANRAENLSL